MKTKNVVKLTIVNQLSLREKIYDSIITID
jgi:hypothetical protein